MLIPHQDGYVHTSTSRLVHIIVRAVAVGVHYSLFLLVGRLGVAAPEYSHWKSLERERECSMKWMHSMGRRDTIHIKESKRLVYTHHYYYQE